MTLFDRLRAWFSPPPPPSWEGPLRAVLSAVVDPELGIDIVSMGLVREVDVEGEVARVRMTLSTRGCPVGPSIVEQVEGALMGAGYTPEVTLEFDPPWTPADITAEGRARLGR